MLASEALGQTIGSRFTSLSIDKGLSSSCVNSILQDRRGFLWFGTADGLNRYDGYDFIVYRQDPADSASISANDIYAIYEDRHGDLWIDASTELNRFDRAKETFTRCLRDKSLSSMCEDTSGAPDSDAMWFATYGAGLYRYQRNTQGFTEYRHDPTDLNSLSSDSLVSIFVDRKGVLWIGTSNGLNSLDPPRLQFTRYPDGPSHRVHKILQDPDVNHPLLWIGADDGLYSYDMSQKSFSRFRNGLGRPGRIWDNLVLNLYCDSRGSFSVLMRGGIARFDRSTRRFVEYRSREDPMAPRRVGSHFLEDRTGKVWVVRTWDFQGVYDPAKNIWAYPFPDYSFWAISMLEDRTGTKWFGTLSGGLRKNDNAEKQFEYYTTQPFDSLSLSHATVIGIWEDTSGFAWVGTAYGLNRLDPTTGQFKHYLPEVGNARSLIDSRVRQILEDSKGALWVCTARGLEEFDRGNNTFVHHVHDPGNPKSLTSYWIESVCQDKQARLWAATDAGVLEEYERASNTFTHHYPGYSKTPNHGLPSALVQDSRGLFWLGVLGGGLTSFDNATAQFVQYVHDPDPVTGAGSLSQNDVTSILEDHNGVLWIGTLAGLNRFDRTSNTFSHITVRDGLASDWIGGILEDGHGCLWLGTAKGISKYDPRTGTSRNYDASDGVKFDVCLIGHKGGKGFMYFGGYNGFVRFHPDSIRDNTNVPPIVITAFRKFDKIAPLDTAISVKKSLELSYRDNVFSFEFAALNFTHPEKNQYAYKLEGFDRDWVYCGTRRIAAYTNLDPGTYTFRVKGSNNDGVWNEEGTSLSIIITPPWWKTTWAYLAYVIIIGTMLYSVYRVRVHRLRLVHQLQLEHLEATKMHEVDEIKSRFFTNISHEFRTPLTLILGPARQLLEGSSDEETRTKVDLIHRSARKLNTLVDELLDLAKIEAGEMKLNARPVNVVSTVHDVVLTFQPLAERKGITCRWSVNENEIIAYLDKDKLDKILTNVLSNAFKFTPEGGRVEVCVKSEPSEGGGVLTIAISDTGTGIPQNQLDKIFDRFYQVDGSHTREQEGTGIGLALTKELVKLHKGKIEVESEEGRGSTFTVTFPLGKANLRSEEIGGEENGQVHEEIIPHLDDVVAGTDKRESDKPDKTALPSLLIVEDNDDVRQYIGSICDDTYRILEAKDGAEGLGKSLECIPDLIITDVMMPKMDGYQLCSTLKGDARTSHIPIIMLTAKATSKDKISGLEIGADDYIMKPFEVQELKARIRNLIEQRKRLHEHFRTYGLVEMAGKNVTSVDQKFLRKAVEIVNEHMADTSFSVEVFAEEMAVSRSLLFRKMESLLGEPPSELIKRTRLNKAAKLIETKSGNVSEIALEVGFNNPSYFAECFRKQFGCTPTQYYHNCEGRPPDR